MRFLAAALTRRLWLPICCIIVFVAGNERWESADSNGTFVASNGRCKRRDGVACQALSEAARSKIDPTPDELFYMMPRVGIYHVDDSFRAQLTQLYRLLLPSGGDILDLCSQHDSHLPSEVEYGSLTVHGMNYVELLANQRATERFTQNFNSDQSLSGIADASLDAALMTVSIQYMQRPVELLTEVRKKLRPGGVMIVSFSNRMFFTKATEIWRSQRSMRGLADLVLGFVEEAGFQGVRAATRVNAEGANMNGDPFVAVVGFKDESPSDLDSLEGVTWLVDGGRASIW